MQIDHLKVFCDLAEMRSFSKAAGQHRLTQSAVTQQIQKLEKELGYTLIERSRRHFALTPEGIALLVAAQEIVAVHASIAERLKMARSVVGGELRVASIFSIGLHELPPRLKAFRDKHPAVQVSVGFRRSPQVYQEVLDGTVDVGLVAFPTKKPNLACEVFEEDEMVLALPPSHPLAGRSRVDLADLHGQPFIAFGPDVPTRKVIDRFLRDREVVPRHVMEFDNIETVKRAVEVGSGISLVPANTVKQEVAMGVLKTVPLAGPRLSRPLGAIYPRSSPRTPALIEFIAALRG
jgi:LysR family transcriptional regulator, transcriptional activator of the cysJI operon